MKTRVNEGSSLADALAEAEQNFLVPAQTQALIWGDLVHLASIQVPRPDAALDTGSRQAGHDGHLACGNAATRMRP